MLLRLLDKFNAVCSKPDLGLLVLRVSFAAMMLLHGWHKVIGGIGGIQGMLAAQGLPTFIGYGIYVGEIVAPILIILGVLTRPSALIIVGTMLVAWLMTGPEAIFTLNARTGAWGVEHIAMFFFSGLATMLLGSGKYSVVGSKRWR